MTDKLSSILFPGSPFQPGIAQNNLNHIADGLNFGAHPLIVIAAELSEIGVVANAELDEAYEWVSEHFHANKMDILHYLYGFTTPPSLMVGGVLLLRHTFNFTVNKLSPATRDPLILKMNQYRINLLLPAHQICASIPRDFPMKASPIFDLCLNNPLNKDDPFFFAGVLASQANFLAICKNLVRNEIQ